MFRWNKPPPQAIFPVLYALCAGVLIWPLLGNEPPVEQAGAQTSAAESQQRHELQDAPHYAQLAASLTALRTEHKEVKRQLQALEAEVAQLMAQRPADTERRENSGAPATHRDGHGDQQVQQQFGLLEEQFYAEPIDAGWAADMQRDFHVIESRLEEFTAATTYIDHHECRSDSCRVEFIHEHSVPTLLPALIASPRNSRVSLKTVMQDGKPKTIALYHK